MDLQGSPTNIGEYGSPTQTIWRSGMRQLATLIALVVCLSIGIVGQQSRVTFEVASVKRNLSGDPRSSGNPSRTGRQPGGGFIATNATIATLIRLAYTPLFGRMIREEFLIGGPGWIQTWRFDVKAKAATDGPMDQMYLMLQALLEDRFGLAVVKGQLERDVYVLVRSRERIGPEIQQVATNCAGSLSDVRSRLVGDAEGRRVIPADAAPTSRPPIEPVKRAPVPTGASRISSECATSAQIAEALSQPLGTPVVDKTGLDGRWRYTLTFSLFQSVQSE